MAQTARVVEAHPITITLKRDGTAAAIFHPTYQADIADLLSEAIGVVTEDRRGGYVYPARWPKRLVFRALRKLFGSAGPVADWTRSWRGPWVVIRADNGERLPGTFPSHTTAVQAEVAHIQEDLI